MKDYIIELGSACCGLAQLNIYVIAVVSLVIGLFETYSDSRMNRYRYRIDQIDIEL